MSVTYILSSVLLLAVPWSNMGAELEIQRLCPMTMGGWSAPCQTECTSDYDCTGNKKCCRRSTCAKYCADPILVDGNGVVPNENTQTVSGTSQNILNENKIKAESLKKVVTEKTTSNLEHTNNVNVSSSPVIVEKKTPNTQVEIISLSSNKCYEECKTSLDCESGLICMELGCHHVCKNSISDRVSPERHSIKQNFDSSRTIQRSFRHSVNRATLGESLDVRGCRVQCNKDGDCLNGYCISVNCHQFCVRNLTNKFINK